jgi:hypothetical protein
MPWYLRSILLSLALSSTLSVSAWAGDPILVDGAPLQLKFEVLSFASTDFEPGGFYNARVEADYANHKNVMTLHDVWIYDGEHCNLVFEAPFESPLPPMLPVTWENARVHAEPTKEAEMLLPIPKTHVTIAFDAGGEGTGRIDCILDSGATLGGLNELTQGDRVKIRQP